MLNNSNPYIEPTNPWEKVLYDQQRSNEPAEKVMYPHRFCDHSGLRLVDTSNITLQHLAEIFPSSELPNGMNFHDWINQWSIEARKQWIRHAYYKRSANTKRLLEAENDKKKFNHYGLREING
jgi:hypothetical protein